MWLSTPSQKRICFFTVLGTRGNARERSQERTSGVFRLQHYNSQKALRQRGRFRADVPAPRSVFGDLGAAAVPGRESVRGLSAAADSSVRPDPAFFRGSLSNPTACWARHEAPGLGAAENAVCVCDGSERGAFHQTGASGTEENWSAWAAARGLLSTGLAALEPGEGARARWSRPVGRELLEVS